ncbi:hypothetical protein EAG_01675 [Camponotus floridanus]|uniref:RNA helicase n=1 Tax=Camponotus floridanus TaxID=104421 RepID=E2AMJ0_CAMFO|nr:hypothetical protein EAG_01675 [Camponotus floridanus]
MESRISIFILCLLYVTRASEVQSEEIEFKERFPRARAVEDLSRLDASLQEPDGTDRQSAYKLRDKRALGLLLSGLAQIFGYTVTPIQVASLPNPTNVTRPAMSSSTMGQQTASTQPMSMNATAPKQQETIRFTGVVNFGNNTDIIGHLQRYEQIFHGRQNNATNAMMMTSQPVSMPMPMPMPPAKISVDPTINSATRPPLLAPFFVKIPLPIAPDLPPATMPIENFKLSVPTSASISIMSESNKILEMPMRKEQETIYRNNENTERLMVEEKDIYDEKDVMKPMSHHTHQLHEPSLQQRHKQEERIEELQEQKERTNCDMNKYHKDKINERNRNREEEIAHRNREHASNDESTEEKTPADDDEENEESAERYEERPNQANKSKQPPREDESEEVEDDEPDQQFREQPENFDKYLEVSYIQQLPIGDYFHEGDPEMIRDSYGEILNNKKLEDDRIGYINMFKHPPVPEDASGEDEKEQPPADGYDQHLIRLQKLREEYALPKNKYEEYDLNDENEAERDERAQNRTSTRPKIQGRVRGKEDNPRARIPPGVNQNILRDDAGNTKSQEEIDLVRHVPLIVPIRYIDANNKVQQATTQQLSYEESDKLPNGRFSQGNVDATQTLAKEKLTPLIGLPERPRKLHEGEHKELQVWPPPFDYAFDNTAPTRTVISPNSQNPSNYQYVQNIAANDANSEHSSEQPSGFLVVVGNSAHPYRYPYNVYYFPNENTNPQSQDPQNTEATYQRSQVYVPQNTNQQFIRVNSNLSEYNLNGTTRDRYHQPHEAPTNVLNRYRYIFNERVPEKESVNVDLRNQIPNNWSSRIYQSQPQAEQSSPVLMQLQNMRSLHQNLQSRPSISRYSRSARRPKNPQAKDQGKNDGEMKSLQPIPTNKSEDQHEDDGRMKILKPASTNKPFDDPQSAHDFFGFNKDDYSFAGESSDALKVAEENGKIMKESDMPLDPVVYHHDESVMKQADEPENDTEKAKVTEYRNKVTTLKISEQRQLTPNGPIHYVNFIRNI